MGGCLMLDSSDGRLASRAQSKGLCAGVKGGKILQKLQSSGAQHPAPLQPGSVRVSEQARCAGRQKILDALQQSPAAAAAGTDHAPMRAAAQV